MIKSTSILTGIYLTLGLNGYLLAYGVFMGIFLYRYFDLGIAKQVLRYLTVMVMLISITSFKTKPRLEIEASFVEHLQAFQETASVYGRNIDLSGGLIVTWAKDDELEKYQNGTEQLAKCSLFYSRSTPRIVIKRQYWDNASYWDRRELAFHELGHCLLGLNHDDTVTLAAVQAGPIKLYVNRQASIMHSMHLGPSVYNEKTASHYDAQLFKLSPDRSLASMLPIDSK